MSERITTKYNGENAFILNDDPGQLLVGRTEFGVPLVTGTLVDRIAKREDELERTNVMKDIFRRLMDDHRVTRPCDGEFEGFIIITPDELGALLAAVEDTMKAEEKEEK